MTTSNTMGRLSKPREGERIPPTTLKYFQARTKLKLFNLIHERFRISQISQAELAKRLGKGTDRVCKLLGAPGNWTLDTVSDLLFAIEGGFIDPRVVHPLEKPKRNDNVPHWLNIDPIPPHGAPPAKNRPMTTGPKADVNFVFSQ